MSANLDELLGGYVLREVVAGELRAIAALVRAVIDKPKHIELRLRLRGAFVDILERVAEGVRGEAQLQPGGALASEGLDRAELRDGERGKRAQLEEAASGEGRHGEEMEFWGYQSRFRGSSNRQIRWRCAGARISDLKLRPELVLGAWQPHG